MIATRIGGIPEVVSEGETGKGREPGLSRCGSDKIIPQYISFYEKSCKKQKSVAA